jgi:hypothetical protein
MCGARWQTDHIALALQLSEVAQQARHNRLKPKDDALVRQRTMQLKD